MGPANRLALLLASIRDASRFTAKSTVCLAGESVYLFSSKGQIQPVHAPLASVLCMAHSPSMLGTRTVGAQGACLGGARCLNTASVGPLRAGPQNAHHASCPQLLQLQRGFASGDLPPHIEMEMPALSPTMSQVHIHARSALLCVLRWLCMRQQLEAHGGLPRLCDLCYRPCIASRQADGVLRCVSKSCQCLQGNIASWKKSEGEGVCCGGCAGRD